MDNIYSNYSSEVQQYMNNVINCLIEDYGKIPESWRISLDLIADNVDIYLKAKKDIDENGLFYEDLAERVQRNPAYTVMTTAQTKLTDLLKAFALTPMSKSKMKAFNASEETSDDYIKYLTNN